MAVIQGCFIASMAESLLETGQELRNKILGFRRI
jgi:hypothetical protein